jgi:lipid-A-disaccharide synthase
MKLLVSALEKSANIHLAYLLKELKDTQIIGIFDKKYGSPIADTQQIAVMGFVDAIKKIGFFLNLKKQMVTLASKADKILLIDSSGFNLPLAKEIKKLYPEKEIIYYILPQAWAWRRGRIKQIVKYIDKACSILPFEKEIYPKNYNISYVGHPLLDEIEKFKDQPSKSNKVVFMPGSRKYEVQSLMPIFKKVAKRLDKEAVLVVPDNLDISIYGDISAFKIEKNAHKALYEAEFAFICSGTATLEASLIGTPLALAYKAKKLDFFIAKTFANIKKVGLANIMLNDIHPEFLQDEVNEENLLNAYKNANPKEFLQKSLKLRDYLKFGSAKNVAKVIDAKL